MKIAAQMYSFRKEMAEDLEGTIKRIQEMGYDYVQVDGMRGHDMHEYARLLKKYDLEVIGMHLKHDRFENDLDGIIYESILFNCKTIYNKYIEEENQNTKGYMKTKQEMLNFVKILSPLGFRIGLHCPEYDYNHEVQGRKILDYFTDPENGLCIYAEPDTYWMQVAGHDPLTEIKKYSGRMPIIHIKDIDLTYELDDFENNLVDCGAGDIDFKTIINFAKESAVEFICIEQDHSKNGDMFKSMENSLKYIKSII